MSTVYTGDPTTVSDALSRTVSAATNATPIVVTTTANHGFDTHDRVTISGVLGNTAANGTFRITKVDPTRFSLDGSVGSGAYTSGGTAIDKSLTPQAQIPSDGDGPGIKAADLLPSIELLFDRTQFLEQGIDGCIFQQNEFLVTGTWLCPENVFFVILDILGNGGAGAGGARAASTGPKRSIGGGSGGGARWARYIIPVTPGTLYDVTIPAAAVGGAAGTAGGSAGAPGAPGADGGDVTFAVHSGAVLARGKGGQGGIGGTVTSVDSYFGFAPGGFPGRTNVRPPAVAFNDTEYHFFGAGLNSGAEGVNSNVSGARSGYSSSYGFDGGSGGALSGTGAVDGGAGAGGGAGDAGNGGTGGNGQVGGTSTFATAGAAGGANTGAGGGGGGGGGQNGGGVWGDGAAGGNGGTGRARVSYHGDPAVVT